MRVLWVGHNLAYPPKGGQLQRSYNLLRHAAKRCEVHMLAFDQPTSRPVGASPADCVRALRKFCADVNWVAITDGCFGASRYWHAFQGLISRDPYDFHWLRSAEMRRRLQAILNATPFDTVHFDTIGLAQYSNLIKASGVVLNHHNIESSMMTRRALNESNPLRQTYWRQYAEKLRAAEKTWCPRFDVNLVVSQEDQEELINIAPRVKSMIVPNGTDIEYFTPRSDPGGRTLLFCGGLDWYPNVSAVRVLFDEIWPRLVDKLTDVEIYIVGRNPPNWLRQLSVKDNRIHVTGFVEDPRPYFRKATAYICPIRDGGGTRLKVLDALAMGVPFLGTSFACSGLSLKNGKHVLLAETPDDFVRQIERLLSSATLRLGMATAGREIVERMFSWNVIGRTLIEAYEAASRTHSALRARALNLG